ncbi:RICIN domain-containing protein [Anaerosacchariphilus polymeriproducens]|uniref:RICIN domain-containing protein n=1 Tax=Anaerosacchariphilus polymeriproducens TaxID=1812858 RepID=UPI00138FD59D|nr:RICIN domain-containing protein [Anaerosacchariphilus polymeriproducens]
MKRFKIFFILLVSTLLFSSMSVFASEGNNEFSSNKQYKIINENTGLCLDSNDFEPYFYPVNGIYPNIYCLKSKYVSKESQKWRLESQSDGSYYIVNEGNKKFINNAGVLSNGYDYIYGNSTGSLKFKLEKQKDGTYLIAKSMDQTVLGYTNVLHDNKQTKYIKFLNRNYGSGTELKWKIESVSGFEEEFNDNSLVENLYLGGYKWDIQNGVARGTVSNGKPNIYYYSNVNMNGSYSDFEFATRMKLFNTDIYMYLRGNTIKLTEATFSNGNKGLLIETANGQYLTDEIRDFNDSNNFFKLAVKVIGKKMDVIVNDKVVKSIDNVPLGTGDIRMIPVLKHDGFIEIDYIHIY